MKLNISSLSVIAVLVLSCNSVHASSIVSRVETTGDAINIYSVDEWQTSGNTMEGFQITVTYADDTTNTANWVNGTGAEGTDGNWSVVFSSPFPLDEWDWNQYRSYIDWDVTNLGAQDIASITFEGMTEYSDLVFDIITGPRDVNNVLLEEYTPESADGRPVELNDPDTGPAGLNVYVEYSDAVYLKEWNSITGLYEYNWYGDLYATLTLDFDNTETEGGLATDQIFTFSADLDNVNVSVPEPATMLLMGLGLVGLAGSRVRRKK